MWETCKSETYWSWPGEPHSTRGTAVCPCSLTVTPPSAYQHHHSLHSSACLVTCIASVQQIKQVKSSQVAFYFSVTIAHSYGNKKRHIKCYAYKQRKRTICTWTQRHGSSIHKVKTQNWDRVIVIIINAIHINHTIWFGVNCRGVITTSSRVIFKLQGNGSVQTWVW